MKVSRYLKMMLAAVLLPAMLVTSPAAAQGSISVSPTSIVDSVASGTVKTYVITISTDFPIGLQVSGLGQSLTGVTYSVPFSEDLSPFSARSFITLDWYQLQPGASQQVTVTIDIPAGTPPGERYAAISFQNQGGGASFGIIIPIILTVDSVAFVPIAGGKILSLGLSDTRENQPFDINTTFSNTGNYRMSGARIRVIIENAGGQNIWEREQAINSPAILPYYPRTIVIGNSVGLSEGSYTARAIVTLPDGEEVTRTTSFAIVAKPQWDINGDHICDVLDLIAVGNKVGQSGLPGWISEDINSDGIIDVLDLILVGNHVGESW